MGHFVTQLQNALSANEISVDGGPYRPVEVGCGCTMEHYAHRSLKHQSVSFTKSELRQGDVSVHCGHAFL